MPRWKIHFEGILVSTTVLMAMNAQVHADVPIDPPIFEEPLRINNPYSPVFPGRLQVIAVTIDEVIMKVEVELHLHETRTFEWKGNSIPCRVVQTLDFEEGRFIGESRKYLAQAIDGTVYFFGELATTYLPNGPEVHTGSWLVGGPSLSSDPEFTEWRGDPTIFMLGNPEIGDRFIREDIPSVLNEINEVVRIGDGISVSGGNFENTLMLRETSTLEPDTVESKWYAAGVGVVKIIDGDEVGKLLATTPEGTVNPLTAVPFWNMIR